MKRHSSLPNLTPAYVRARLSYDPQTGALTWKPWPSYGPLWNGKHVGRRAGCCGDSSERYHLVRLGKRLYRSTHLIWMIVHGRMPLPGMVIDHIDRDRANDSLMNLRECTQTQNCYNRSVHRNNKSGVPGVHRVKRNGLWMAYIGGGGGRRRYLGCSYATKEEAIAAREKAMASLYGPYAPRLED